VLVPMDTFVVNKLYLIDSLLQQQQQQQQQQVTCSATTSRLYTTASSSSPSPSPSLSQYSLQHQQRLQHQHQQYPTDGRGGLSPLQGFNCNYSFPSNQRGNSPLHPLPKTPKLTTQERALLEKTYHYMQKSSLSTKSIVEMAWIAKVSEQELVNVVKKVDFLEIVKC
jgi:hypothetical protein